MELNIPYLKQCIPSLRLERHDREGRAGNAEYSLLPIAIDSRLVEENGTFWTLPGAQSRGAQFIAQACEKGIRAVVIEEKDHHYVLKLSPDVRARLDVIIVPDTYAAFMKVAQTWRKYIEVPIIGITGSVGKTTTKELLRTIFMQDNVPIFVSKGNQNTLLGVALNLLHLTDRHTAGIFEVGINEVGEMDEIIDLLRPTMGVITTISAAHLHGLGSVEEVAKEKKKIFSHFLPSQIGIICGDVQLLSKSAYHHPVVRFGLKHKNSVTARCIQVIMKSNDDLATKCLLKVYDREQEVTLSGNHIGVVYAALAAASICYFLQTPFEIVIKGLEAFEPVPGRFQPCRLANKRGIVVNDAYNASPASMKAALGAFHQMNQYRRKVVILGDMFELGDKENFWHRQIGRELGKARSITDVILVGKRARKIGETAPVTMNIIHTLGWNQACEELEKILQVESCLVLVKASHAVGLDNLVKAIT